MKLSAVAIRVDASTTIGHGHVVRCLALADALRDAGTRCQFICRAHPGHLLELIQRHGHDVTQLPVSEDVAASGYAAWLGDDWECDARLSRHAVAACNADCVVVDHYALDERWELAVREGGCKVMVIDDLANRPHACELLLDQTFGRRPEEYLGLLHENCTALLGAGYALLRPEFSSLRDYSLGRRRIPVAEHLLISMGGVDPGNVTSRILLALEDITLPAGCRITVLMGPNAPHLSDVLAQSNRSSRSVQVHAGADNVAKLLASADLAIGASGVSALERCCLGVPTISVVIADNQRETAARLSDIGASAFIADPGLVAVELPVLVEALVHDPAALSAMSAAASRVTDGTGVGTVVREMGEHFG